MATIGLKRGVTETIASAVADSGTVANDYRTPAEAIGGAGALEWQTTLTGGPASCTITLQGSNDGTNWNTLDTSTAVGGEIRAVNACPMGIRLSSPTIGGGTAPKVSVTVRVR